MPLSINEGSSGGETGMKQAEDTWRNLSR